MTRRLTSFYFINVRFHAVRCRERKMQTSTEQPGLDLCHGVPVALACLKQIAVGVEGLLDGTVPHQHLDPLWPETLLDPQRCSGMAQGVKRVLGITTCIEDSGRNLDRPEHAVEDVAVALHVAGPGREHKV